MIRKAHGWAAVAAGIAMLATAVHLGTLPRGRAPMKAAGVVPGPATPAPDPLAAPASPPTSRPTPTAEPSTSSRSADPTPTRLVIPSIGVDAPVVPEAVTGGAFQLPTDPSIVGWWSGGERPGASSGTVLLAGHVDSAASGPGALFHLDATPVGAQIVLRSAGGAVTYRVVGRRAYAKAHLPQDIFARTGTPRLVVVTCGGRFDTTTRHYTDNIVVYAVPAS